MREQPHVLVLDTDEDNASTLAMLFQTAGFSQVACNTPEQAYAAMAVRAPDVIVTELELGGITPADFMRKIRSTCAAPVIGVTTLQPPYQRDWIIAFGRILVKPSDPATIIAAAKRALGSERQAVG